MEKKLYIIAGCNGAGKTTASFNILPDLLDCKEYVNADEIARGLSPFQPEKVSIEAGRIMLQRISELLQSGEDFAFETTLSTKSFKNTVKSAKENGYFVSIIFFWLESSQLAKDRVKNRVLEGGHSIEEQTIERRYYAGIKNLFEIYSELVDYLIIYDNSKSTPFLIAEKEIDHSLIIHNQKIYNSFVSLKYGR
jgi:predicted ABC-type ATPase